MNLTLATFAQLVRDMSPEQLLTARKILEEVIKTAAVDDTPSPMCTDAPDGAERRRNPRFNVHLKGTLRPMIPGKVEPQPIQISIIDVSRDGMRFVIENGEGLYPIVEITFTTPTGRLRSLYAKLVRTRMVQPDPDNDSIRATEVAATAIDANDLASAQQRHRELVAATKRIPSREHLPIVMVGEAGPVRSDCERVLDRKGHPLNITESYDSVLGLLAAEGPQLLVYSDGSQVLLNQTLVREIHRTMPAVAQIAVIGRTSDRRPLIELGIDECVHSVNASALMVMYVDRAIKSKLISTLPDVMPESRNLLIHSGEDMALAQLGTRFDPDFFNVIFAHDTEGMQSRLRRTDIDVLMIDQGTASSDDWGLIRSIRDEFPQLQILVTLSDPRIGPDAVKAGASDYLLMPCAVRTASQLITASLQAAECEVALKVTPEQAFNVA